MSAVAWRCLNDLRAEREERGEHQYPEQQIGVVRNPALRSTALPVDRLRPQGDARCVQQLQRARLAVLPRPCNRAVEGVRVLTPAPSPDGEKRPFPPLPNRYGFRDEDGDLYLERCPACELENYAMNVALGICTWCGWTESEPFDHRGSP